MSSIATVTTKKTVTKRVVSSLLIAMLGITAMLGSENSVLNSAGLLTLIWPLLMTALASYWLREFLSERADHEYDAEFKIGSNVTGSGFFMAPVCLSRM